MKFAFMQNPLTQIPYFAWIYNSFIISHLLEWLNVRQIKSGIRVNFDQCAMYLIRYFVKCKPSGILLKFFRNSSKIQIGIPIRKATGFANMIYFTYKYSFSTCLVNVSCRWCIALWFEKISWPASNNCPFSWCCWNKKWRLYLPNETKREKPSEINIGTQPKLLQSKLYFICSYYGLRTDEG